MTTGFFAVAQVLYSEREAYDAQRAADAKRAADAQRAAEEKCAEEKRRKAAAEQFAAGRASKRPKTEPGPVRC